MGICICIEVYVIKYMKYIFETMLAIEINWEVKMNSYI